MSKIQKSEPKITRKNVPLHTKLKLFSKSAGRCQFRGCNKLIWRNDLTLTERNFGEVAHIIAASASGPRGNQESKNLQIEYSNLMLLCQRCHTEVDSDSKTYSEDLLREWKKEHENRIEIQTRYTGDIHKSTVLLFMVNINERLSSIKPEVYHNAMFPKFPVDDKGIRIAIKDFDGRNNPETWEVFATQIRRKIEKHFEEGIDEEEIKHLSVFALGPMPLLMYLGKCIGDTISADLYQKHRKITDTNHAWSWRSEELETEARFITNPIHINKDTKNVGIVLSLSAKIPSERFAKLVSDNYCIYEITIENPSMYFLKCPKQIEEFSRKYRELLNDIQTTHGDTCNIFIIPAVPAPIAVECGRVILPKSDPVIFACEYDDQNGLRTVLKINSRL